MSVTVATRCTIPRFLTRSITNSTAVSPARPYEEIPSPPGLPFLKNLLLAMDKKNIEQNHIFHKGLRKQYGDTYKLRMPGKGNDMVFVSRAEDSRTLLKNDGATPYMPIFDNLMDVRGNDINNHLFDGALGLLSQGETWQEFRQAVQKDLMNPQSALHFIPEIEDLMDEVLEKLARNLHPGTREVDQLSVVLQEFALEAVCVMFLGAKIGTLQGSDTGKRMYQATDNFFRLIIYPITLPNPLFRMSPWYRPFVDAWRTMTEISHQLVTQAKQRLHTDTSLREKVLGKMILRCGEDSNIPTLMAIDALGAGQDTTGVAAHFLLHHLAINPVQQERLYKEILTVMGKEGRLDRGKLVDMRYLKACVQESMRLLPVAGGTVRMTQVDMELGGFTIPKGTKVTRVGMASSIDEANFVHAEDFIPERWIRGCPEKGSNSDSFASLPFGHGPRSCIGQRFAKLELYILTARIIQKYRVEREEKDIEIVQSGLFKPAGNLHIKFHLRN